MQIVLIYKLTIPHYNENHSHHCKETLMHTLPFKLSPVALAALIAASPVALAQTSTGEPAVMPTVVISASADASAQGLPSAYAGGQVARGGRVGLLGNVDVMDTPFNTTNYTQALIQDQQARSVADVLQNDPSSLRDRHGC